MGCFRRLSRIDAEFVDLLATTDSVDEGGNNENLRRRGGAKERLMYLASVTTLRWPSPVGRSRLVLSVDVRRQGYRDTNLLLLMMLHAGVKAPTSASDRGLAFGVF